MKFSSLIAGGAALVIAGVAFGDVYDNGPFVTHPGGGYGGADLSSLQNSSLGLNILGFGHQVSANHSLAEDFVVPAGGWTINTFTGFAYQTFGGIPSTMTAMHLQIWDGDPSDLGSSVIWGDMTTNVMDTTDWTGAYRATETDPMGSARAIMQSTASVGITLDAGTYWIQWQMDGSASSGPWAPPISIIGETETGNALQNISGSSWGPAMDSGTNTQQGFPFLLDYTPGGAGDCLTLAVNTLVSGNLGIWSVSNATPGAEVAVVYGHAPGSTLINGYAGYCSDFGINGVNQNRLICRKNADGAGNVMCRKTLPNGITGVRVLSQASERNTCPDPCMSNLDDQVVG